MTLTKTIQWTITFLILSSYTGMLLQAQGSWVLQAHAQAPMPAMQDVCYLNPKQMKTLKTISTIVVRTSPWQPGLRAVEVNGGAYGRAEVNELLRTHHAGQAACGRTAWNPFVFLPMFFAHIS